MRLNRVLALVFLLVPATALTTLPVARTASFQFRPDRPMSEASVRGEVSGLNSMPSGWARTFNTFFQGFKWEDGYSQWDTCAGLLPSGDGGIVLAGTVELSGPDRFQRDVVVMKMRPSGTVDWKIRYDCDPNRLYRNNSAAALVRTHDGGYLVIGVAEDRSILALKISRNGGVRWVRSYAFGAQDTDVFIMGAAATQDGGSLISGLGMGPEDDNWVLKLDPVGNVLWHRHFNVPAGPLQPTPDSGFIMASYANDKALVLKFDRRGNIQWSRSYVDDTGWDCDDMLTYGNSIIPTKDGGYVLTGETFGCSCCNNGYAAYWVCKLDRSGRVIGSKEYGLSWATIYQTRDSGYMMESFDRLMKLDPLGAVRWKKYFPDIALGPFFETSERGYVISGQHFPEGGMIVLCVDRQGGMGSTCPLVNSEHDSPGKGRVKVVTSPGPEFHENSLQVFPLTYNPHPWTYNSDTICSPVSSEF